MAVQPTFLMLADIGGYTRFMNQHRTSLAHAHDIIARLLETVIDAAQGLTLAKLEGDAAFFYTTFTRPHEHSLAELTGHVARIYRAFHERVEEMKACNHCGCDACQQIGNLKIKFTGHYGEAAIHKIKRMTELAGVDVILVHRLLKNTVPVPEYLLMTEPVLSLISGEVRNAALRHPIEIEDLGTIDTYFIDVQQLAGQIPAQPQRPYATRFTRALGLLARTFPYVIGVRKPCSGFRNLPSAHVRH